MFKTIGKYISTLFVCCVLTLSIDAKAEDVADPAETFESLIPKLVTKSYKEKQLVIEQLSSLSDERLLLVFSEMLGGRLYYTKSDKEVVFTVKTDDGYKITSVLSNDSLGVVEKRKLKKVKVNNKLRGLLRGLIARLNLQSDDVEVRFQAVYKLFDNLNTENIQLLRELQAKEKDDDIKSLISIALAIDDLNSVDQAKRLAAVGQLDGSLIPQAKNALQPLVDKGADGQYLEENYKIRKAAQSALKTIDSRIEINAFAETLFFGLSLGSVLLLAAIGLAITFGVMGVINMAHGEMMMLGAYTTYIIQSLMPNYLDYSLFISIPAAFVVAGLFGIAIERGIIRFLYGRPLETLLATFGVSLILQQLVRTTISAQNVTVSTPSWMSGSLQINPVLSLTYNRLYIIIFSLIVFFALLYVLKKTVLGLQVRAVSQNRAMAKAMGVRSDWVDALTFGLGSGIAGIAGVALSQLTNVGPNLGQSYIIDSFMVVVFGGVGNLWGTLVGAMSLGVVNKFLEPWSGAVLAKILVLIFIILFIQKKPRGLFPQKGRAAEN